MCASRSVEMRPASLHGPVFLSWCLLCVHQHLTAVAHHSRPGPWLAVVIVALYSVTLCLFSLHPKSYFYMCCCGRNMIVFLPKCIVRGPDATYPCSPDLFHSKAPHSPWHCFQMFSTGGSFIGRIAYTRTSNFSHLKNSS